MTVDPTNLSEVAWSSWLPAVGFALARSAGPVLELGVGHFSTPFLHEYCRGASRELWSVESDDNWRTHFDALYSSHWHRFGYPTHDSIPKEYTKTMQWGLVFIDSSPGGRDRANLFGGHIRISDFVVVHDYHRENEDAIRPLLSGVSHRVFSDYDPPTLLASTTKDVR